MMTEAKTYSDSDERSGEASPVVRDATFTKLYADRVILQNLGRDIDLCLIQFGRPLTHYISSESDISVDVSECVTEAGRVRVAWPVAVNFAMNIITQGIENGLVKGDKLIEHLQETIGDQQVEESK